MKPWKYALLLMALPFLNACSSDDVEAGEEKNLIRLEALHPGYSRVTDTDFEKQDKIGLYMTQAETALQLGGNVLNNEQFLFDGSVWNSRKLYWDKGTYDVYAYYPFTAKINDVEKFRFEVALDQDSPNHREGMSGYEASDFLWASKEQVTASSEPIQLQFSHCMSKLVVKLEKGVDYEGEIPEDLEVYIHNTIPVASIDLNTGGTSKDDFASSESIKARKLSRTEFAACLVPQQIMTRRPLIEVLTQGVSYLLEGKISLKQGVQHTIVVALSKNPEQTKIEIGGEIKPWN